MIGGAGSESKFHTVFFFYCIFLLGYFFFPQPSGHYKYYYFFVFPGFLFVLLKGGVRDIFASRLLFVWMAYILFMGLSPVWGNGFSWDGFLIVVWHVILVVSFIIITVFMKLKFADEVTQLLKALVWVAVAVAALSIFLFYSNNPFPAARLEPFGRMNHPILAGCVYGFFALLSMSFFCNRRTNKPNIRYLLSAIFLVSTVLLTQSRTPLVALIFSGFFFLKKNVSTIFVFLAASAVTLFWPQLWDGLLRGTSYRPSIWLQTLKDSMEHILFGVGYMSNPTVFVDENVFAHAHNAYLATLRDGGIIGIVLFVVALAATAQQAFRLDKIYNSVWHGPMIVYAMVCMIFDFDRIITRPKELWVFFWLPVALVIAHACQLRTYPTTPVERGRRDEG